MAEQQGKEGRLDLEAPSLGPQQRKRHRHSRKATCTWLWVPETPFPGETPVSRRAGAEPTTASFPSGRRSGSPYHKQSSIKLKTTKLAEAWLAGGVPPIIPHGPHAPDAQSLASADEGTHLYVSP